MVEIEQRLQQMLDRLAQESPLYCPLHPRTDRAECVTRRFYRPCRFCRTIGGPPGRGAARRPFEPPRFKA